VTPDVALDGSGALLLETGRTAHFLGGERALAAKLRELARRLGFETAIGVAATPEAARVLARAAPAGERFAEGDDPRPALAPLPWRALDPPAAIADAFAFLGVRTIGELLRLPRAGLATRTSVAFVQQLQRMLGELPEPLERIAPPFRFERALELPAAATHAEPLLAAARRLLEEAAAELQAGDRALVSATITLVPLDRRRAGAQEGLPAIELAPSEPTRDAGLLLRMLGHRLERERLAAPVEIVKLAFDHVVPRRAGQEPLFPGLSGREGARDRDFERDAAALRDRLAVRLGEARVLRAELLDDHRPERAFRLHPHASAARRAAAADAASSDGPDAAARPLAPRTADHAAAGARPLELEAPPRPVLVEADETGRPRLLRTGGRARVLRVVRGPERIASGWWDGADVERAYFEVEAEDGARLWLFRDLTIDPARDPADGTRPAAWYHHGTFL